MVAIKFPDLEEEAKKVKKNIHFVKKIYPHLEKFLKSHPKFFITLFLTLLIIVVFIAYSFFGHIPFSEKRISIIEIQQPLTKCEDARVYECAFSMDKEGKDWEIGQGYSFRWVIKTNVGFDGHAIVYLRPAIETGLVSPIASLTEDDKLFVPDEFIEFEGEISTLGASAGRYNLCGILKDNDASSGYLYEKCDSRQIVINSKG